MILETSKKMILEKNILTSFGLLIPFMFEKYFLYRHNSKKYFLTEIDHPVYMYEIVENHV